MYYIDCCCELYNICVCNRVYRIDTNLLTMNTLEVCESIDRDIVSVSVPDVECFNACLRWKTFIRGGVFVLRALFYERRIIVLNVVRVNRHRFP